MEQFSLDKYLENPSRKVVTRRGNLVRIICTDRKHGEDNLPIVFLEQCHNGEFLLACRKDGRGDTYDTPYDLFFADEEEVLTEFEKELEKFRTHILITSGEKYGKNGECVIKNISKKLLDLARKELEKSIEDGAIEFVKSYMENVNPSFEKVQESEELWKWKMSCLRGVNKAYTQGKQDALKDLPKWKKATEHKDLEKHVAILEDGKVLLSDYLEEGDYYIDLEELKTLLKEE